MAEEIRFIGAHRVVRRYTDVQADFPTDGLQVTDITRIFVDAASGSQVDIKVTYDFPEDIEGGTASFYDYDSVTGGSSKLITLEEYAPTGIQIISSAAGDKAWVIG